ncbi:Inositol-1-monophosphatase [[Actinomadura] parvosata subsp. kistnae]|uniref:Inositol-1-monophosphatase n=1 Tax=[Actinomadura] parvosata subsp. kistnae TaxID=1909395 RepID=A0A1U9ZV94_9ACTN|nr:inositol monophosphatase family protein [Nonomuraea sp. ATCC 55076]AQZ61868.1 inositol monophosphatase [Nonomuraea sp. ATCC 55076]SPL88019.1 Inositol-1-monophosphatase [Actinomadura parvosata subsp. kistnae]
MDLTTSRELAAIASRAARAVGDRLRGAFRSRPEVATKRDFHDPVTEHDKAAEEEIREVLARHCPDSLVVGEEGGSQGDGTVHWYVDPIDGTANFAAGLPFFCTSIGAAVDGEMVAGVVYDPVRDDEFTAWLGGAQCNGEPIRSTGARTDREAVLLSSYPAPRDLAAEGDEALHRFARMVNAFASTRRPGSAALKLAHVAAGWSDVAFGTHVNVWDVAAGSLLVRQAGGTYLPLSGSVFAPGGYLACVGGFDLDGSVMAEVATAVKPA